MSLVAFTLSGLAIEPYGNVGTNGNTLNISGEGNP